MTTKFFRVDMVSTVSTMSIVTVPVQIPDPKQFSANLISNSKLVSERTSLININFSEMSVMPNTAYNFNIPAGFWIDQFGDPSPEQTISFTTPDGVIVTATEPALYQIDTNNTNTNNTTIILYFDRNVIKHSGTITLNYAGGSNIIANNKISVNKNKVTLDVLGLLKENTQYYLTFNSGLFTDTGYGFNNKAVSDSNEIYFTTASDIIFKGLKSQLSSSFTTAIDVIKAKNTTATLSTSSSMSVNADYSVYIKNAPNTTYIANNMNAIFLSSSIQIIDDAWTGETYRLDFICTNGKFGTSNGSVSNYSLSGDLSTINSDIKYVQFFPTKNYTGSISYTLNLYAFDTLVASVTKTLTYASTNIINNVYSFTSSSSWAPTVIEQEYALADAIVVGGGAGGGGLGYSKYLNCGGGAGNAIEVFNAAVSPCTFTVGTGGIGGTSPSNGTASIFTIEGISYTANGGSTPTLIPGWVPGNTTAQFSGPHIAFAGSSVNYDGYTMSYDGGVAINSLMSGSSTTGKTVGGGGAGSRGGGGGHSGTFDLNGGNGGNGLTSSITGTSIMYAGGGGGGGVSTGTNGTTYTTPGSGGYGGREGVGITNGKNGIIIIRTHT